MCPTARASWLAHAEGSLITPEQSARSLVALLRTAATGRTRTVSDHTVEEE